MTNLIEAIRGIVQERSIPENLVINTIRDFLLVAYKKTYGTDENAIVHFNDEYTEVSLYAEKQIVETVQNPALEILLQEALNYDANCEIGDKLQIEIHPNNFNRLAIQSAKQCAQQAMREIRQDTLYSEYNDKVGDIVVGYYQRERNGTVYVDLGNTEGILPRQHQSSREVYSPSSRIKALVYEVNKQERALQIILSRSHPDFIRKIFELEIPEIYDRTIEIKNIVREPGYRSKIVVSTNREEVDPVGACVGLRGVRILAIIKELGGEKIDVINYSADPATFIKGTLAPAQVSNIYILDEAKRHALAVVPNDQLSICIGKMGMNVRLANKLTGWNIDIKTEEQFASLDMSAGLRQSVESLFKPEEITKISDLTQIPEEIIAVLGKNNIDSIEELLTMNKEQFLALDGMTIEYTDTLLKILEEEVEIVEQSGDTDEDTTAETDDVVETAEDDDDSETDDVVETAEDDDDSETDDAVEAAEDDDDSETDDATEFDATAETDDAMEVDAVAEKEIAAEAVTEEIDEEVVAESEEEEDDEDDEDEISIRELPDVSEKVLAALEAIEITGVLSLMETDDDVLLNQAKLSREEIAILRNVIEENVKILEYDDEEELDTD